MSELVEPLDMTCKSEEQDINMRSGDEFNETERCSPEIFEEPQTSQSDHGKLYINISTMTRPVQFKQASEKIAIEGKHIENEPKTKKASRKTKPKPRGRKPRRFNRATGDPEDAVERKPSAEGLKSNPEDVTSTTSFSSLHHVDNSLGETLATSLQLIANDGSSSPPGISLLEHTSCRGVSVHASPGSHVSQVSSPVKVLLSPGETSPPRTRSSGKKRKRRTRKKKEIVESVPEESISDSEMMKPILHKDGSVTLFQCEVCHKLFNKRQTLRQHFITHTDRFACHFCEARCKSKGDLRTHIQTHTKEKPYHCDVCNTDYTRESILRKHLKTQLHLRAVCEMDNVQQIERFTQKKKQIDQFVPYKAKVRLNGFSCKQCSKVLLTKREYRKHIKSHSMTHICNVCQKGCKTALLLKVHSRSHSTESRLACKSCSRKFATLQCLKDHLKTHKTNPTPREPKESLIKAVINKHNKDIKMLKVPTDPKDPPGTEKEKTAPAARKASHECKLCHRMFTSEKRLSNHSQTHKEVFTCSVCTQSFPTVSKLKHHMTDHDDQFKCEICHASYADKDELKTHVENEHCEGNELVCKICYQKFEAASDVHRHMNTHAPTMLFSGGSLDESSIPVVIKGKRGLQSTHLKVSDSEDSSDEERKPQKERTVNESVVRKGHEESDNESELKTSEFLELMDAALDMNDYDATLGDLSDFEDEFFTGIVELLESEILSSAESDAQDDDPEADDEDEKPILYCHGDIVRKHSKEFELHSHKDPANNIFQCTLCAISFDKDKYLSDHLKSHVCEYCNKFFAGTSKLSVHKSNHVKRLLSKIDGEAKRVHHTNLKYKSFLMDSSDSEGEYEDRFLNELEDILESDSAKNARTASFLKTLSHDDIVKVNKPLFDQHSFVDITNNIFACTICKRKYARPTTLTRHFKTHVCQYCNTFFTDKSDLLEHKYKHRKRAALMKAEITGEGGKMPPSPVVSKENRALFKRFSFIDSMKNINRCTLCSKDFVRRTVLTRHLKTHICAHCDKFFEDKYDLVKHATYHKVEKQYTEEDGDDEGEDFLDYDEDTKPFVQASPLTATMEDKTLNIRSSFSSSLAPYSSPFHAQPPCNGRNEPITYIQLPGNGNEASTAPVYSTQSNGTSSFQILPQPVTVYKESGSDSFLVSSSTCRPGGQEKLITISQPQMLQGDSGQRDRLFECGQCGKRFFKNGHLKSHMTIHTGSRPYVCSVCGKGFGRGTTLRKHEKTHLKRCKICDTTFSSKYELDIHLEIHRTYAFYK